MNFHFLVVHEYRHKQLGEYQGSEQGLCSISIRVKRFDFSSRMENRIVR